MSEAHGDPRTVLAQCYGTLLALHDDAGPVVRAGIATDLANIERVMGELGDQWRAERMRHDAKRAA